MGRSLLGVGLGGPEAPLPGPRIDVLVRARLSHQGFEHSHVVQQRHGLHSTAVLWYSLMSERSGQQSPDSCRLGSVALQKQQHGWGFLALPCRPTATWPAQYSWMSARIGQQSPEACRLGSFALQKHQHGCAFPALPYPSAATWPAESKQAPESCTHGSARKLFQSKICGNNSM